MTCLTPYVLEKQGNTPVPCGKCPTCIARRTSAWSFRLMQEGKRSTSAHFVTLTYSTKHVPITPRGFMSLSKRDIQLFFKRYRKANPHDGVKYYAVGEYGGKTKRPHYHIIFFNGKPEEIAKHWALGEVHFGEVNGASIGYTLKYLTKFRRGRPDHKNDDRAMEFAVMSKLLGSNYLTESMIKYHKQDPAKFLFCTLPDGKKVSMPRYYKDKIYTDLEKEMIKTELGQMIAEKTAREKAKLMKEHGDNYYKFIEERNKELFARMYSKTLKNGKI